MPNGPHQPRASTQPLIRRGLGPVGAADAATRRPWGPSDAQRKANLKMAWILAALAAAFGLGFFVRIVLFGA